MKLATEKTEFLPRMSHEIRTPINGIIGSLSLFKLEQLKPQQAEDLQRAILSCDRLLMVVNEILEFSKIESTEIEYSYLPFNLEVLSDEIMVSLSNQADKKEVQLVSVIDPDVVTDRIGDQQKIHQILTNLINNSIKFSDQGSITLSISNKSNQLLFEVKDQGIGIPDHLQATIFDPFTQVNIGTGGTGLGLSISKTFVQGMGGRIWLESTIGLGTTFSFILPLEADDTTNQSNNRQILAVDDDEINLLVVERHLQQLGHQTDRAINGQQALAKYKAHPYKLILMDIQMPVLNGIKATQLIRQFEADNKLAPATIVALTASVVGDIQTECHQAGMNTYLSKPFKVKELQLILQPLDIPTSYKV